MMFPTTTPQNPPTNPATTCHDQDNAIARDVLLCMSSLQVKNKLSEDYLSLDDMHLMVDFAFKALKKEKEWKSHSDGADADKSNATAQDFADLQEHQNQQAASFTKTMLVTSSKCCILFSVERDSRKICSKQVL